MQQKQVILLSGSGQVILYSVPFDTDYSFCGLFATLDLMITWSSHLNRVLAATRNCWIVKFNSWSGILNS